MTSPKPRTLKYAERLQAVEERIVDALPEIIDALMTRAGNTLATPLGWKLRPRYHADNPQSRSNFHYSPS